MAATTPRPLRVGVRQLFLKSHEKARRNERICAIPIICRSELLKMATRSDSVHVNIFVEGFFRPYGVLLCSLKTYLNEAKLAVGDAFATGTTAVRAVPTCWLKKTSKMANKITWRPWHPWRPWPTRSPWRGRVCD